MRWSRALGRDGGAPDRTAVTMRGAVSSQDGPAVANPGGLELGQKDFHAWLGMTIDQIGAGFGSRNLESRARLRSGSRLSWIQSSVVSSRSLILRNRTLQVARGVDPAKGTARVLLPHRSDADAGEVLSIVAGLQAPGAELEKLVNEKGEVNGAQWHCNVHLRSSSGGELRQEGKLFSLPREAAAQVGRWMGAGASVGVGALYVSCS